MGELIPLASLIGEVASESDGDRGLACIARSAKSLTQSRHVIVAVLNDYLGHLEVRCALDDEVVLGEPLGGLALQIGDEEGIVGYVAATGASVVSGDVKSQPHYKQIFGTTVSEVAVPIRDRNGRVRAVLSVSTDTRDAYSESDREILDAHAHLAALVLEQESHAQREEALIQIGRSLRALNEDALIDRVIHVAKDVLRLQACSIFLVDPVSDTFVLRGTVGWARDQVGRISYQRGEGFTGWVGDTGESILLTDPQSDPRWRGKYVEIPSDEIASFLAVPIVIRNKSVGVIRVLRRKADNRFLDNRFTQDELRLIEAVAEQVAAGLENVRNVETVIRNERMIAWGELSAKSSHMIGNRVFALKGDINELGHVVEGREISRAELQDLQASLAKNLTRIEEILQDFRDFVSATQIERQSADLNAVIRETANEVFPRRSEIRLELSLANNMPEVWIDQKRFRRAISELIENSLNHVQEGRLQIVTRVLEASAKTGGKPLAEIEIADTGPGIEPDQKARIFQPFFSRRVKGMGLGLSIVKGIIDAHGGEVYEAGGVGQGAQFFIHLPIDSK